MPVVNPQILVWARKSAGYDLASAATKLDFSDSKASTAEEKLQAYELGERAPSRPLLVRMAKQYRRPLLTFYLNEPPETGSRGEDYRTLTQAVDLSQNALVDALVRNVKARQEIVRDAFISAHERKPLTFVGSFDMDGGVNDLVAQIQERLYFDLLEYRQQSNQDKAFKYLRTRVENCGVFTLLLGNLESHHTNLSTEVFRGFALSDDIAPFIVVNDQDAKTAWPITLIHELAHLWLGETGISGANFDRAVESFCNEVASELLLPERDLTNEFRFDSLRSREAAIDAIDTFASDRKVSSRLIAFRLLKRDAISQAQFNDLGKYFYERWLESRAKRKARTHLATGGPSYYVLKRHRVGSALVEASERLLRSGELSTTKAATVLGVRALKVEKMFSSPRPI